MNIGDKIKKLRIERGLTMKEVATKVEVSEATISRWESGDIANMKKDKIAKLAKALNAPTDYLMGWDDPNQTVKGIIDKRMEELGITLSDIAQKTNVSLHWLENIDSFVPGQLGNYEIGYDWITKVAEILEIPGNVLRKALSRQEAPIYDGDEQTSAIEDFSDEIITIAAHHDGEEWTEEELEELENFKKYIKSKRNK
jgi:transcriptional regulator with XRE-family HTH domain